MRFALLAALTAAALGLRLWGIGFGLPWHFHPDEPAHVLEPLAVAQGASQALSFANPPLYKDLLLVIYTLTSNLDSDTNRLFLVARATSAVLGALTVPAAYLLASSLRDHRAGLIAAALTAVAFLLVRESHFAVNDTLVTLLATLALAACVRMMCRPGARSSVLTGGLIGLTFAAKYPAAAAVGLPFFVAWIARRRLHNLLVVAGSAALAAVTVFPSLVLEPARVISDFYVFDLLPSRLGYDGIDPGGGYGYYLNALAIGLGWPLAAFAALGLAYALFRRELRLLVVASLPIVLYLALGASRMYFARFLLAAYPALSVLAAVALVDLVRVRWVLLTLILVAAAWTAKDSFLLDALLVRDDTRLTALNWIEANVPSGARIAVDSAPLGVPLRAATLSPATLYDSTLADYRQARIEYLVTSSFVTDARPIDPSRDEKRRAFNALLADQAALIAEFRPAARDLPFVYDRIYAPYDGLSELSQPGPTIRVYRLNPA